MSEIAKDEVIRIAKLARIALSEDEVVAMQFEMQAILGYMDQLRDVNVDSVPPMSHPAHTTSAVAPLRADRVSASLRPEEALEQAPDPASGGFAVPRVL